MSCRKFIFNINSLRKSNSNYSKNMDKINIFKLKEKYANIKNKNLETNYHINNNKYLEPQYLRIEIYLNLILIILI